MVDETALQNYLLKCELQYRAEHADGVERVGWLMEYTKTVKQTARFFAGHWVSGERNCGRCGLCRRPSFLGSHNVWCGGVC